MTESYNPTTPLWKDFDTNVWLAQTFSPRLSHDLKYGRIKILMPDPPLPMECSIRYVGGDGLPTGNDISIAKVPKPSWLGVTFEEIPLLVFSPIRLTYNIPYALLLRTTLWPPWPALKACYQPPPGGYIRGKLVRSVNAGTSWESSDLGDLFFSEWGNPPLPPSLYIPPLENFALMDIAYTHWDVGLTIRLPTNVPCHLTCYYTEKQPLKHDLARTIRGLTVPWSTYFCFVAWKSVEQTEPGDTLYHTFEFPDWTYCQTKWFTFRGQTDLADVPSVGPIFEHHHPGGLPHTITLRPNAPGDLTEIFYVYPPGMPHWQAVSDSIPDEDATNVNMQYWVAYQKKDLYRIETPPADIGKIASVEVFERTRAQYPYLRPTTCFHILKTHGTIYEGPRYTNYLWYQTHSKVYTTNPFTNEPWTLAELLDLQIGVELWCTYIWWTACTQVYAIVHRGIEGGPD